MEKNSDNKKIAFVLGGGGARGAYTCGALHALKHMGIEPDMVVGTSVGSILAAGYVQGAMDEMLAMWENLETDEVMEMEKHPSYTDYLKEFIRNGGADCSPLHAKLMSVLDEDLVRKSKIDFGLATAEMPSLKPHYLWKDEIPKGKMGDFIMASCAAFPIIRPYSIDGVAYVDGAFAENLPITMAKKRGADLIIAIDLWERTSRKLRFMEKNENLVIVKSKWPLGRMFNFDTKTSSRLIILGYLDTLKTFGILAGDKFAFEPDSFSNGEVKGAEALANIFDMSPVILYDKETFIKELKEYFDVYAQTFSSDVESRLIDMLKTASLSDISFSDLKGYMTILIFRNFMEKGAASIFATEHFLKRFPLEIRGARFLVNHWDQLL